MSSYSGVKRFVGLSTPLHPLTHIFAGPHSCLDVLEASLHGKSPTVTRRIFRWEIHIECLGQHLNALSCILMMIWTIRQTFSSFFQHSYRHFHWILSNPIAAADYSNIRSSTKASKYVLKLLHWLWTRDLMSFSDGRQLLVFKLRHPQAD